jgi:hypothetical protein
MLAAIPESQMPFGNPGEPDVVLWPLELHVQRT